MEETKTYSAIHTKEKKSAEREQRISKKDIIEVQEKSY
jgi:hypothetical protein